MAKTLTNFVKSIGANGPQVTGLNPMCVWDFMPNITPPGDNACCNFVHEPFWCVPEGITCARIELWGAGGNGAGACNCSMPGPSGSGAYVSKMVTTVPGECYRVHLGWHYCRRPPSGGSDTVKHDVCTVADFNSWVTGTGLTNFCAEQGCMAVAKCCDTATGSALKYVFQDSAGEGARYFGGDCGQRGRAGWIQLMDSALEPNEWANYRQGVPYPGGMINKCGGHHVLHGMANSWCSCKTISNEWVTKHMRSATEGGGTTAGNSNGYGKMAGWGVPSPIDCAGSTACCSAANTQGRARISFSCCNTFKE